MLSGKLYVIKRIVLFIGIFCSPLILKAQWFPVSVPTTQSFDAITFTDTLHGFIAVMNGTMLQSSDGGFTWQIVPTGSVSELADVCFPNASIGYTVGNNGVIIKTVNGGVTWPLINSPTGNVLRGVYFLNPDTGFICGQGECIYRTTNGGTTWVQQSTGAYWLRKFSFPTQQIGYCAGDNHLIFKTTNGGLTWNQIPGSGGINLNYVQFLTVDTGYVCGLSGYVAKSVDAGLTWQVLNTGTTTDLEGLWFFNSHIGYCVGLLGLIMKTTDGGATWTQQTSGSTATLEQLYFFNQNQGFICGFNATLLKMGSCLPAPGSITGPTPVCQGDTGKIYSVTAVSGATGYNWSVPPGVIITSGNNTNIITVKYTASSASGLFSVFAFNANCNGSPSPSFPVIVNNAPYPAITGPVSPCVLSSDIYFTDPGMTSYVWTVSSGGTITSGPGTDSITVTWNSSGPQDVTVLYTSQNGCTAANPTSFNLIVNPIPGSAGNITGPSLVCDGATGLVYSVSPITGANFYVWTLPSGFTIVSGDSTNSITVDVASNASPGTILVSATNLCGSGPSSPPFPVMVNQPPTGTAGPDGSTCQTNSFTVTQASASNDSSVSWYSNGQGVLTGTSTLSPTYTPAQGETGLVTLTLIIYGNAPCLNDTSTMILTVESQAIVNAGGDLATCGQTAVVLSGSSASNYQFLFWTTTGSGMFNDATILHPTYTPGSSDVNAGSVILTLHATPPDPCEPDSSEVLLTIAKPVYVYAGPDSSICQDQPISLNNATAGGYTTISWSTTGDGTFNNSNIVNPVYTPGNEDVLHGNTMLIITAEGVSPCLSEKDSMMLTINRKPAVHPGPDGTICQGMTFTVEGVTASDFRSFTWESNGLGVLSGTTTLSPVYTPGIGEVGTVTITLKVFGILSCSDSMVSCQIKVNIYSDVKVDAGKDQTIAYGNAATLRAEVSGGTGSYSYEWEPSSLLKNDTSLETQTLPLKNDTVFIFMATDKVTGCSASDSIKVLTEGPGEGLDSCIVIHNVITPNGDGKNDTWIIDCIENYPDNTVKIFNRWGDLVNSFDRYDNTTQGWKGTNKKGKLLPSGTYYYVLMIKNEKTRTGWILLRCGLE